MVIASGFIPLSCLSIVLSMILLESSQWLGENIVRNTGRENPGKNEIMLKKALNNTINNQSSCEQNEILVNPLPYNATF